LGSSGGWKVEGGLDVFWDQGMIAG
jgi:hypothetical protein